MGYYVDLNDHDFTVKVEHYPTIIERWLEFEKENLGYYTSIFNRSDDMLPMQDDVARLFQNIGFDVSEDGEQLTIEGWEGKSWLEAQYIHAIADLAEPGWYLDWHGEDDEHWRQTADGQTGVEYVYLEPSLRSRLTDLTTMLDVYDEGHPSAGEGAAAEVSAAGPIIEAVRQLIKDLS
jgi:hypothetical protein